MPQLQPGRFSTYALTDEEQQAAQFNAFHIARLHNERTIVADAMLGILLAPDQKEFFVQNQAFLKGKLQMLEELMGMEPRVEEFVESKPNSTTSPAA